jgi:hypothetical protein
MTACLLQDNIQAVVAHAVCACAVQTPPLLLVLLLPPALPLLLSPAALAVPLLLLLLRTSSSSTPTMKNSEAYLRYMIL